MTKVMLTEHVTYCILTQGFQHSFFLACVSFVSLLISDQIMFINSLEKGLQ